jgi:hypothetical protein
MRYFLTRTPARVVLALVLVIVASVVVVRATDFVGGPVDATESPTAAVAEATATPTATPTETATPTPSPTETPAPAATFKLNGGGAKNIVVAKNHEDGRFLVRGRLDLNQVGAPKVAPVNLAYAMGYNCTGCNTLAVAAQITLYKRGASLVAPQNAAVAVNAACSGCYTRAWAIQWVIPVDNMNEVPRDVDAFVRGLDAQLRDIEHKASAGEITLDDAVAGINALLDQFRGKAAYLNEQSDVERNVDTPSPYPSPPPEPSESPAATPAETAAPTEAATP